MPTPTPSFAPTPTPDPTATPTPTPTPTPTSQPTLSPSGPILVKSDNVTIDGVVISSSGTSGTAIDAEGTASNPIDHLTIRNCTIKGFGIGIDLEHVTNFTIENCKITDANYIGILVRSGVGGTISNNTIERIGPQTQAGSNACNGRGGSGECDSYGITVGRISGASGGLVSNPRSANISVSGNLVTDVPTWHGLDTHAGQNITFDGNTVLRCMRAAFLTGDGDLNRSINVVFTNNVLQQALSYPAGGTSGNNLAAVTLYNVQGGSISSNSISLSYETPAVYDYLGLSTGMSIFGNSPTP